MVRFIVAVLCVSVIVSFGRGAFGQSSAADARMRADYSIIMRNMRDAQRAADQRARTPKVQLVPLVPTVVAESKEPKPLESPALKAFHRALADLQAAERGVIDRKAQAGLVQEDGKEPFYRFRSEAAKATAVAAKTKLAESIAKRAGVPMPVKPSPLPGTLAVGQVGTLDNYVTIIQVWNEGEALAQTRIDRPEDITFLLHNVKTAGWTDNREVFLLGTLKVTGTRQYENALGTTGTVFVLEPQ